MQKNIWNCIFRASRRVSEKYFPKAALDYEEGAALHDLLEFLWIMLQYSVQAL